MRCNICEQDKELNQFQTYWHSTQEKMRTRKQCTECYYKLRLKDKNPDKFYLNNPEYKKCTHCNIWKKHEEYYVHNKAKNLRFNRCAECQKKKDREVRQQQLENNCGSEKVLMKPNQYTDIHQKKCTFELMKNLGYTFNEEYSIWTKSGVKELINGKLHWSNIKKRKYEHIFNQHITTNIIREMIKLRNNGEKVQDIARILNVSDNSVYKYLKKNNDKIN